MYSKRSLYSGWLEFLKFPTLCKLWELFSLQIPRNFHSQTSFVRFHPTKAEVDIRPKIQGESHTSSWALSFCTVPASLGLCSVNFSHFGLLDIQTLSLQLSKIFGLWLVSPSLCCSLEIVSRLQTWVIIGLPSPVSLLFRITVLHCLLSNTWKQMFHKFCLAF